MIELPVRDLHDRRHEIVLETAIEELPVLVVAQLLVDCSAESVSQRAEVLPLHDPRVEQVATVMYAGVLQDLEIAGLLVDLDHGDFGVVGEAGEHRYAAVSV